MDRSASFFPAVGFFLSMLIAACASEEGGRPGPEQTPAAENDQDEKAAAAPAPSAAPTTTTNADPVPPPAPAAPASGCGVPVAKTGAAPAAVMVGTKERSYLRFVPKTYDPARKMPLVIAFHTLGDTPEQGRAMYDLEPAAAGGAIIVYPAALPSAAYDGKPRWDLRPASEDFAFVDAVIQQVTTTTCIDPNRVFTTGFSNGGRMAALVACRRGDVIRGVAPVAPGGGNEPIPATPACTGDVAVWEMFGDADEAHEPSSLAVRDFFLEAGGCTKMPTKANACVTYAGCKEDAGVTFCRHPGAHVWPASAAAGVWGFFASLK